MRHSGGQSHYISSELHYSSHSPAASPPPRHVPQGRRLTDRLVLTEGTKYRRVCKMQHANADGCVLFAMHENSLRTDTYRASLRLHASLLLHILSAQAQEMRSH